MNGAPPPSDKVRSSQLEGLLTSQPWKPMRGSSSTARLNPQAGGGGVCRGSQSSSLVKRRERVATHASFHLPQMAFTCLRVLPSPFSRRATSTSSGRARVFVCVVTTISAPRLGTGDWKGWGLSSSTALGLS